jgi:hypothetical protein
MTTPIAERVAKPSHGRALSGDLSYSDDRQPRRGRRHPAFTQELPRKLLPTRAKGAQSHSPEKR